MTDTIPLDDLVNGQHYRFRLSGDRVISGQLNGIIWVHPATVIVLTPLGVQLTFRVTQLTHVDLVEQPTKKKWWGS